jgi:hypothetical protein
MYMVALSLVMISIIHVIDNNCLRNFRYADNTLVTTLVNHAWIVRNCLVVRHAPSNVMIGMDV